MPCIGFFLNSQLGKREFANLYYKGFSIIFRIKFLQILASNIAQPKYKALDRSMMQVLFRGRNPTKHHIKCFKPNTYVHLSKIKNERTSKVRKSITRDKNLNDSFYLIFFDTNTNFKTLQTF
jgi:hypothetical protein